MGEDHIADEGKAARVNRRLTELESKSLPASRQEKVLASPYQIPDAVELAILSNTEAGKPKRTTIRTRKKQSRQVTAEAEITHFSDITDDSEGSDVEDKTPQRTRIALHEEASVHPHQSNASAGPILAANHRRDQQEKAQKTARISGQQVGLLKQRASVQREKGDNGSTMSLGKVRTGVQPKQPRQATAHAQLAVHSLPTKKGRVFTAVDALGNTDALQASSVIRNTRTWQQLAEKHSQAPQELAPPAAPAPPAADVYSLEDLLLGMFAFVGLLFCMGVMLYFFLREPMREHRHQLPNRQSMAPRLKALNESRGRINDKERMDLSTLRYNLKTAGVDVTFPDSSRGLIGLHNEVQARNCEVLWVSDPESGHRLIRLVRLFRGLVTIHREDGGDSVLTEESRTFRSKSDGSAETQTINKPITFKMRLDVVDVLETGKALLAQRLNIPRGWQKRYMHVADKDGFSYVEEDVSSNYPGLVTWYLIEEWRFGIDFKNIPEEDQDVLGLPDSQTFTTSEITAEEEIIYSWKWQPQSAQAECYWSKSEESQARKEPLSVDDFANARTVGEVQQERQEQRASRASRGRYSKAGSALRLGESVQPPPTRSSSTTRRGPPGRSLSRVRLSTAQ
eukprot:TRINITY_DN15605_c0_g2_i1.p1 TRINITY_DN15605_c0_g2~~TRINITY_DN15605_c0_g2_i1.p1  ORF type:complete len:624 (-),score=107.11 TRINITY_DN15605_c0_g2_i1:250-2121(-)